MRWAEYLFRRSCFALCQLGSLLPLTHRWKVKLCCQDGLLVYQLFCFMALHFRLYFSNCLSLRETLTPQVYCISAYAHYIYLCFLHSQMFCFVFVFLACAWVIVAFQAEHFHVEAAPRRGKPRSWEPGGWHRPSSLTDLLAVVFADSLGHSVQSNLPSQSSARMQRACAGPRATARSTHAPGRMRNL